MSVDILPVSARTSRKHGGLVSKATEPSDLRIRLHFENQVVTGYRQTGAAYLVMRLPVGALPIYARYDVQGINAMFPNDYGFSASYGDIWEELGASGSGSGGDSADHFGEDGWYWDGEWFYSPKPGDDYVWDPIEQQWVYSPGEAGEDDFIWEDP